MDDNNTSVQTFHERRLGQLSDLVWDVMRIASYATESGKLPDEINLAEIYRIWDLRIDQGLPLSAADIQLLQDYYQILTVDLAPISAISLRATECDFGKDAMQTEAGKHARRMWYASFTVLGLIMFINLFQYIFEFYGYTMAIDSPDGFSIMSVAYWVSISIAPFAYGAFGAAVRLLRVTETKLRERSFDPRRLPEHRNRFVLGTLSGGVLVMLYSSGGVNETSVKLTEAAIGFIAGYSIDVLFSVLDSLVAMVSPAQAKAQQAQAKVRTHSAALLRKPFKRQSTLKEMEQELKTQLAAPEETEPTRVTPIR